MINNVLSEKEYQKFILERLSEQGYLVKPSTNYDRLFAIDRETLFEFLYATQPEEMTALEKVYKSELREVIVQMNMLETFRNATPSIDFLFWQPVYIVRNFLVRDKHKVHLHVATTITLFGKVLQHFCIAQRGICNVCLKVFTKFVVNNINTGVPFGFDTLCGIFV